MTTPAVAQALDAILADLLGRDAPLGERLRDYAVALRKLNPLFAEAVDRLVARLNAVGAGNAGPRIGERLLDFLLPSDDGQLVSLPRLLVDGPVVVAFRRGHWCPYCQIATDGLARMQTSAQMLGARVVVITPDREQFTKELKNRTSARFPILTDIDNGYALSVGVAISVGEEMRALMSTRGRDLAAYQGNDAWLLPIPATFVLDRHGVVRQRHVDPDYRVRAPTEDIVAALREIAEDQ